MNITNILYFSFKGGPKDKITHLKVWYQCLLLWNHEGNSEHQGEGMVGGN